MVTNTNKVVVYKLSTKLKGSAPLFNNTLSDVSEFRPVKMNI